VVVPGDLTLQEAVVAHVTRALHGAYPVVDADGRVAGILTLAAIRAVPAADRPRRDVTAVMATDPTLLVTPATAVDDVLARPAFLRTGRVVAVDGDGRPVGILSVTDIAREELLSSLLGVDLPAAPRAA
jgi:predicted transcriptional regulator